MFFDKKKNDKDSNNLKDPNAEVAERDNPDTLENLYGKSAKLDSKTGASSTTVDDRTKTSGSKFFRRATWVMTIFTVIVCILAIASISVTIANKMKNKKVEAAKENITNVSVKDMQPELFELELSLNAELRSLTGSVSIMAPIAGTYTENKVQLGDRVKKGDILGVVDATDVGINYNSAPIYAKADGIITSISSYVNQKVNATTVLYTIEQDPDFVLDASVSESDVTELKEGILGRFKTAGSSTLHTAHLNYIAPSVNTSSRTVAIQLKVDTDEKNLEGLRSGNYVSLSLLKSQINNALVVPRSALRTYNTGYAVFTVDDNNVAHRVDVEVGDMNQTYVVITKGIQTGDKVVTKGTPQDGDKVQIVGA